MMELLRVQPVKHNSHAFLYVFLPRAIKIDWVNGEKKGALH